jgi:hypothetical protein
MKSADLTSEQVDTLKAQLLPHLRYLRQLYLRMEKRGFGPDDELFKAANEAYEKIHSPLVKLHYLSCEAFKREFDQKEREIKRKRRWRLRH